MTKPSGTAKSQVVALFVCGHAFTSTGSNLLGFEAGDRRPACSEFQRSPADDDEEGDEERGPSPEALAVRAFDRVRRLAPFPRIVAAPDGVGLTGLPTFVWLSEEQPTLQATAGAGGLTVTAEASATSFTWGFGDGPPRVTSTGGEPWTRTSPGSVSHTYERKGSYEMTVVVLWTARWRVGAGPWLPLGSFTTEGGRDYAVRQVVAVLKRSAR